MKTIFQKLTAAMIIVAMSFMFQSHRGDACPQGPIPECSLDFSGMTTYYPHEYDCHWFFQCSDGVAYCWPCPDGLHWNTELNVCDWPYHANCLAGCRRVCWEWDNIHLGGISFPRSCGTCSIVPFATPSGRNSYCVKN